MSDGVAAVGAVAGAPSVSVRDAVRDAAASLAAAGCDTPRLDAELLLSSVLGVDRSRLVIDARCQVSAWAISRFEELVLRRAAREPVAYITGVREFRRITLHVDPRVLIPRPETELLVEVALSLPRGARVVDVGTGSGAVALALADERADLSVVGIDVSPGAIAVARANAAVLGLDVQFVAGDLLGGAYDLSAVGGGLSAATAGLPAGDDTSGDFTPCDAILANLPYVPDNASLSPEIIRYEPAEAVFGGADGLDLIRRLVSTVGAVPLIALEVGFDQSDVVAGLLTRAGFGSVERLRDLAGHDRVLVGRRRL